MSGQVPYVSQSVGMTAADAQQVGTDQTVVASTTSLTDINKVVRVEASLTGASITGNCAVSGNVSASSLAVTGAVTFSSINSTPIGATTPSTGAFTTLSASSINAGYYTLDTGAIRLGYGNYGGEVYQDATTFYFRNYPASVKYLSLSAAGAAVTGNISSSGRTLVGTTTDDGVNALQVNGSIKGGSIITSSSPSIAVDAWFCLSSAGARRFEWHKAATSEDMVAYKLTGAVGNESAVEVMRVSNSTGLTTIGAGLAVTGNISSTGTITPQQATTAGAPAYVKGAIYFDTTLNKLRVGGATAWETITSV